MTKTTAVGGTYVVFHDAVASHVVEELEYRYFPVDEVAKTGLR